MKVYYLLLCLLVTISLGCYSRDTFSQGDGQRKKKKGAETKEKGEGKIVPVKVVRAHKGAISSTITGTCTIEVEQKVDILSEISGIVKEVYVKEGQKVKAEAVLLRLDDENLRFDLKKAIAELKRQESAFERIKKEYEKRLIPRRDYDEAEHQLELARLQVEQTKVLLKKTVIKAPFPGVLTEKDVTKGEQILANKKLFTLVNLETTTAEVFVPETEIPRLERDQKAVITIDSTEKKYEGKVERISPIVDRSSGMVKVTLSIEPPHRGLMPGAFARVIIVVKKWDQTTLIPKKALVYREGQIVVFVVDQNQRARERKVEQGVGDSRKVQIKSGVQPGESIVVEGHYGLRDGQRVEIFSKNPKKGE